jgi:KDO2-lipid IV(A) lauroyltransferase
MTVVLGDEGNPKEARRLARKSFRHYLRVMGDFIRLPQLDEEELERNLTISGWESLVEALDCGKGAIVVGGHIGHWDLSGIIVAIRGYPMNAIVESFDWPEIDKLVQSTRDRWGMKPIPMERALRLVYKALRANEVVGILVDRPSFDNGVPVTLFGRETRWPSGPATLAIRTGAKVLVGSLIWRPDGRFDGDVQLVDDTEITGDIEHDVRALTQEIASRLESAIRACPQQWCMFRQMWPEVS